MAYAAGAAIVGGAVAVADAKGATPARAAWDAALARLAKAEAASRADDPIYDRVRAAWEATKPSIDMIHWREFSFADREYIAHEVDIDQRERDDMALEGQTWWGGKDKKLAAYQSVRDYRAARERHSRESGIREACERSDRLLNQECEIRDALMAMPAPDAGALQWKLEWILDPDGTDYAASWHKDYIAPILADVRRLAAREA